MTVESDRLPVTRPNYKAIRECAQRYPGVDLGAVEMNIELNRVGSQMFNDYDAFFARFKISKGRFLVLVTLFLEPDGCSPGDLAEKLQVTRATMTGLIDTLEQDKYIERRDDPSDRRMYRIVITQAGGEFLDRVLPANYRRAAVVLGHLSADEREELTRLLRKVEAGLDDFRTQRVREASES